MPKRISLFGARKTLSPTQHQTRARSLSWATSAGPQRITQPTRPKPIRNPESLLCADAFKFNGPAPELINGRLSMVGFLAGAAREVQTGETLLQQARGLGPGTLFWLALIVVASLQPITRAAKSEPFGESSDRMLCSEKSNCRAILSSRLRSSWLRRFS